jgi:hypothetical protein
MRHLIYSLLLCLLLFGSGWGQAIQHEASWCEFILDDDDTDTSYIALPPERNKATFLVWVRIDSVKKSTAIDSINIWYRFAGFPGNGLSIGRMTTAYPGSTSTTVLSGWDYTAAYESDGSPFEWKYLQITGEPNDANVDFDSTLNGWLHGRRIPCTIDFDGYPYTYIQFMVGRENAATSDCVKVHIGIDVD